MYEHAPARASAWQRSRRGFALQRGTRAPEAAGKIHSDMEKGFIIAETMHYDDLREAGSETEVRAAGKYRQNGKEYVVRDGDILFIRFNAGAGLSAAGAAAKKK